MHAVLRCRHCQRVYTYDSEPGRQQSDGTSVSYSSENYGSERDVLKDWPGLNKGELDMMVFQLKQVSRQLTQSCIN